MDFDKISGKNNSVNISPQKSVQKPIITENKQEDDSQKDIKKSPTDPKYWQSYAAISASQNEATDYFEECKKMIYSCFFYEPTELKENYIEKLKTLIPQGKAVMQKYVIACSHSAKIWNSSERENFNRLLDELFEDIPETDENTINSICRMMEIISDYNPDDFEKGRAFLKFFMTDDTLPFERKLQWFKYAFSKENLNKTDDENKESMQIFSNYISCAKDKKEFEGLTAVKLPEKTMLQCAELMKAEKLSSADIIPLIKNIDSWNGRNNKDDFLNIVSILYNDSIVNNDDTTVQYLKDLSSNELLYRKPSLQETLSFISEKSAFKSDVLNRIKEIAEKSGRTMFDSFKFMNETLCSITPENIDDCINCAGEEMKNGNTSWYSFFKNNTNPKTGLFDKSIYDAIKEYKRKEGNHLNSMFIWFHDDASSVIKAAVDMQTGELSPIAMSFIDKYFLGVEENLKTAKIKSLAKNIKDYFKYTGTPLYKNDSAIHGQIMNILNMIKDKNGAINLKNVKYMSKILELPIITCRADFSFFENSKDENGVIDESKINFALKILQETKDMEVTSQVSDVFRTLGIEDAQMACNSLDEIIGPKNNVYSNLSQFVKHCWGDGEEKIQNAIFVKDLSSHITECLTLNDTLFEVIQNEDNKKFILDLSERYNISGMDLNGLIYSIKKYADEDGKLSEFTKKQINQMAESKADFYYFDDLYEACITDKANPENGFLTEEFNKVLAIYSAGDFEWMSIEPKYLIDIVDGKVIPSNFKFKEKVSLLNTFINLKQNHNAQFDTGFLNTIINELDKSIRCDDIYLPISEEVKSVFNADIVGARKQEGENYTNFEKIMIEAVPLLKNMPNGLNIRYSQDDFLEDLSSLCDDENKIKILREKTGITPIIDKSTDSTKITGYNGILILDNLDKNDEFEAKLYNLIHRFMYENEVITGNAKLDCELNKIIKACPEFINIIGKTQHGTHSYTLDIHSLLVLANSISDPNYLKLNPFDKGMLKISALFHDIAKAKDTVDTGHQEPSSIYVRSIIKKFFNNEDTRDRVYELVRNHHWLAAFQNASDKDLAAKEIAYKFRRYDDFEIAKIMAKADLVSVSDAFYDDHKAALDSNNLKPIQKYLDEFYSSGSAIISDYPKSNSISDNHIEVKDNKEYKVINFHEIDRYADLSEYGFEKGKTKDNVNFLVHMVDDFKIRDNLKTVDMLTSPVNGGVLSESIITPNYKRTYSNRKYGVILSQINANLINMNSCNQGSGCEKDFNDIIRLVFGSNTDRNNFKIGFLNALGIEEGEVSDSEFAEFYKKNILSKNSYSQFSPSKEFKLGNKTLTGMDIVNAIKTFQNSLIDKKENTHNELVGYIPKIQAVIAKEKSLNDVPDDLLDFAYENNLPVVLV